MHARSGVTTRDGPDEHCSFSATPQTVKVSLHGKWLGSGRYGKSNIDDVAKLAIDWLRVQGAGPFDSNAGRKSLARLTRHLGIPYEQSFPIHGDHYDVWQDSYEETVPKSGYKVRKQPRDPDVACVALRKMAHFLGAGRKVKTKLSSQDRWSYHILKALGKKKKADKIRLGLPSSDEDQ